MAMQMVTPAMRKKAEALAGMIPMMSKGRSKRTGAEFVIVPGSQAGTAWWANFAGCTCPGFRNRGVCAHQLACDILGEREEAQRTAPAPKPPAEHPQVTELRARLAKRADYLRLMNYSVREFREDDEYNSIEARLLDTQAKIASVAAARELVEV